MNVFRHTGDLGDIIAALPVIRQLGGGRLVLGNVKGNGAREPMSKERFDTIAPLLRLQPYLSSVEYVNDASGITHDFHNFRITPRRKQGEHTLINWQGDYFCIKDIDLSPWITGIIPSLSSKGKVIFSRTQRYHNPNFNWLRMINRYPNSLFIGLENEYWALYARTITKIPWHETRDLLEVAQLIAGSDLIVCNQSCPFWIAVGMGHPLIQETDLKNLNSVIPRENAKYVYDGTIDT